MSTQLMEVSLSLRTPQLTAFSAPGGNNALRVWGAFALLMMLVTVPLFSTVLAPLFDYPNHLARSIC